MKLALTSAFLLSIALTATEARLPGSRNKNKNRRSLKGGKKGKATWTPGDFSWGMYIRAPDGGKIALSNGLMGKNLAITGHPVRFADGSESSMPYHIRPDGAGVFTKEDGSGYYYAVNSEYGDGPDGELWGGVYTLEMNNDHEVVDYYPILTGTVDNCAGGSTPWGTWVSCEEEGYKGYTPQCWQTDPAGEIEAEIAAVTPGIGNYEAFAWDDIGLQGFTTDDAHPGDSEESMAENKGVGALVRYLPSEASLECYHKETKADRWCTLNEGTLSYLKLHPTPNSNKGTFEWVENQEDSNPELYRKGEGIHVEDSLLTFVGKTDKQVFFLDLEDNTYEQYSTMSGSFWQEPDNLRVLDDVVYLCSDDDTPNGVWGFVPGKGAYPIIKEITLDTEAAGVDFTDDAMYMYVNFQGHGTYVFWREDGLAFDDKVADILYA